MVRNPEDREKKNHDRIRILALNKRSWHHSRAGGAEINLEQTLKRLAERDHQIHLLVGSDGDKPRKEFDDSVSIRRVGFDHRFPPPWDVVVSYLTVSIYFYWQLYRFAPDVVYTVNSPLPWPVITRRPRVTIFHHIAIDSFFDSHPFPQNVLGYTAQWLGVFRERRHPTVSVSPSTTEDLVSRGHDPETIHEIRNGIDIDKYGPGIKSETPRVVYLGALERYKGVDRIPQIHRNLLRVSHTPVQLDIAGRDGPLRADIEAYCDTCETAHYHGFVSEQRKLELLQSAWIFIAPSRVEGYGIAVIEANACRTPAVGSDVSGLRDSIRDEETGLLVNGSDLNSFAVKINNILVNDEKRDRLAEEARFWAKEHSWEQTADRFEELFLSVVAESA